tara:strand:- start:97 stop:624 length:528 start_codon:yes stop_codon:yes gene_type:complete
MKKISKLLIAFVALINLNACMTTQEAAQLYNNMSEQELCMGYLTNTDINIYQQDRRASIQRRGLNCSSYAGAAQAKLQADQAMWNSLHSLNQALNNTSSSYGNSSGSSLTTGFTKVCYYNGVGGQSAITVSSVSLCPLTNSHNISGFTKVCTYPNAMGGPKAITVPSVSLCPLSY